MNSPGNSAQKLTCLGIALAALVALPPVISADTIILKDSTTYQGRITERTDAYVVFEVNREGGLSATMRFDWRDIAQLTESPPEAAQLEAQYRERLAAAEEAATADAHTRLGRWAHDNKLYDQAVECFERAMKLAPGEEATLGFAIAQSLAANNQLRKARGLLKDLAAKFPGDDRIAAELAKIDQQAQKRVDQMMRSAIEHYKKDDMAMAIRVMERLQRLDIDELEEKADYAAMQQAAMAFGDLLGEARLHQPCHACSGTMQLGLQACSACNGTGRIAKTRIDRGVEKDPKTGVERRYVRQIDYEEPCPTCHGFTAVLCQACHGSGVDLGTVGPVERQYVADGLKKRIEQLNQRLSGYVSDPSSLHIINLEVVHLHALRLQYYIQQLTQLEPKLVGDELKTLVACRNGVNNLVRHTTAAYRSRDLKKFEEAMTERLRQIVKDDGILWPKDLDYKEPTDVSAKGPQGTPRP